MPVKGGIIGPLLTCLIGDQFVRLKKGDSFWYERTTGPQKFSSGKCFRLKKQLKQNFLSTDQLRQIFTTSLSTIICRNSDKVEYSQRYVMKRVSITNRLQKCSDLDTFDFKPWKEKKMTKVSIGEKEIHSRSIQN